MTQEHENISQIIHPETLLRGEDVARILNISRSFAFSLMKRGEIPTVRLGYAVRVRPEDLRLYIETCLTPPIHKGNSE